MLCRSYLFTVLIPEILMKIINDRLVLCPGNTVTKTTDLGKDRISRRGPGKGSSLRVVGLHKVINLRDQVFDAAEGAAPNGLLTDPSGAKDPDETGRD